MYKRFLLFALILLLALPCAALGEGQQRVWVARLGEAAPIAADAETLDLYVVPVLGADCMVLTAQGKTMLVDMGSASSYGAIDSLLSQLGIESIDIAFNSHPHNDHLGAMEAILKKYPVGEFITAFPEDYTGSAVVQNAAVKALHKAEVPIVTVKDGDTLSLGGARMTVIRQEVYDNPNRLSAMLRVEYGDCTLLLTGDVTDVAQTHLAENYDLSADILKYPHHGLNRLEPEFLEAVSPEYAFITHGYLNTKDAQAQLAENGIPHDFATWGVIHLQSDGESWLAEQWLTEDGKRYEEKYR